MASSSFQCRKSFNFDKLAKEIYQWFPGHMAKGLRQMYEQLPNVDAVIEVHDARAPFTGRNLAFRRSIIGAKPYAYVLNKADLADLGERERIVAKLAEESYAPCYFTVLRDSNDKAVRDILPNLVKQIDSQLRFNRELVLQQRSYTISKQILCFFICTNTFSRRHTIICWSLACPTSASRHLSTD